MDLVLDVLVPLLTFLTMVVVGLDLTRADFARVVERPGMVVGGSLGQLVLLPAAAILLARALTPPEVVTAGMAVIAACPGGALSNLFTYLARANVALSVTLTAVSSLLATVTVPLLVRAQLGILLGTRADLEVPVARMIGQLVLFLLLPIVAGMVVRARRPGLADRHGAALRNFSVGAGLLLVAFVLHDQRDALRSVAGPTLAMAFAYTLAAMAAGGVAALVLARGSADRLTVVIEFACRNLPIATLVGATLLHQPEFVVFAAAFFLVQTVVTSLLILAWRRKGTPEPGRS